MVLRAAKCESQIFLPNVVELLALVLQHFAGRLAERDQHVVGQLARFDADVSISASLSALALSQLYSASMS